MNKLSVLIAGDDDIRIGDDRFSEKPEVSIFLTRILADDPDVILVIEPSSHSFYKGIGKVIYASQSAGVPVENLKYKLEHGEIVTFDELRSRQGGG
jgi:hypothetical protein